MLGHRLLVNPPGGGVVTVKGSKARDAAAITPSDTTDLAGGATDGIYVGGAGDLVVTLADMADEATVTFTGLAVGMHPISAKRVWEASTATNLLAVYG